MGYQISPFYGEGSPYQFSVYQGKVNFQKSSSLLLTVVVQCTCQGLLSKNTRILYGPIALLVFKELFSILGELQVLETLSLHFYSSRNQVEIF